MERRVWGWVGLISKEEGNRETGSIYSCWYNKRKWTIVFVALVELASRQTGTDGLTHSSVRSSYGVRKARLGTKVLEDLICLWLLLLQWITALCSSCTRHTGQTWHWWHWGSGIKPACACSLPCSQLAEHLLWDPAGGRQGPAEGNIWTHSCYQMSTSSKIASSKVFFAKMSHLSLLQEAFVSTGYL